MTKTEMRRAAAHLRTWARDLRDSNTLGSGKWPACAAVEEDEYRELMALARKLEGHARTLPHKRMLGP